HIMADLDLEADVAQWLQSVFMLVNGIMIPVTAFLIGKFTTRRLFFTALTLFGIGTLVCGTAPNFTVLMFGRILQASGAGIIMPLMQTILFLVYPREKRGTAMGFFGLVISFAPASGRTFSAWFFETFRCRGRSSFFLPFSILALSAPHFLPGMVTNRPDPKLGVTSIVRSTLGLGGLLYGFSVAGSGWLHPTVVTSLLVGAVTLTLFIRRQFRLKQPILEFRVFGDPVFTLATIIGMVAFMTMIGGAIILPIFMQNMLGLTAFESGLMLLPGA